MDNALCLLSDVCRLCLNLPGEHDIFKTDNLIHDIFHFTGIKVSLEEPLPQNVCSSCLYKIEVMKDLKECASSNDSYMHTLLNDEKDIRHQVLVPKTSTKIMSEIVGEHPEKVKKCLVQEEKQRLERKNKLKNKKIIEKNKQPSISVRSIKDINSQSLNGNVSRQSTRIKNEKSIVRTNSSSQFGDNEHKCEICKKTYSTWKKLYCHQRSHTKHLFCPLDACGKSFATKGDLQKHIRAHTGERPYQCNLCDKSFTQNVTLKAHRKSIHGGL